MLWNNLNSGRKAASRCGVHYQAQSVPHSQCEANIGGIKGFVDTDSIVAYLELDCRILSIFTVASSIVIHSGFAESSENRQKSRQYTRDTDASISGMRH